MAYAFALVEAGSSATSVLKLYAMEDSLIRISSSADSLDTQVPIPKGLEITAQDDAVYELVEVKAGSIVYQSNRT